jgi:uncharacterized membrane protein YkvI
MNARSGWGRFFGVYIAPATVFQSVLIGGGYGTGREIVEYFGRSGVTGGLFGLALACVGFGVILFLCFELARLGARYDYRSLLQAITGPFWIAFEICFLVLFVLVLGVVGSAAGVIFFERFAIPPWAGSVLMLVAITVIAMLGRQAVLAMLSAWSIVLSAVLVAYVVFAFDMVGPQIAAELQIWDVRAGWARSALEYVFYNAAVVPVVIYSARQISSTREAAIAAILAAAFATLPAVFFHLTFAWDLDQFTASGVPVYDMIDLTGRTWLVIAYMIALIGTLVQTGLGFVQGVIERLDAMRANRKLPPAPAWRHAVVAAAAVAISAGLSFLGIINLIGAGYRIVAWGLFVSFILPLLTVGVYKVWRRHV